MSRHITYQVEQPTAAGQAIPRNDLGPKLKAAITVGLGIFIISLTIIILIISATARLALMPVLYAILTSAILGILATAGLAITWSLNVAQREWLIDSKERKRRWRFEDEDRLRAAWLAEETEEEAEQPGTDHSRIPPIAFEILRRHFAGLPTTRKACVVSGLCTEHEWNLASRVFKAIRLKSRYKLVPGETLEIAWQTWQRGVELYNGRLWLLDRNGKRIELIE